MFYFTISKTEYALQLKEEVSIILKDCCEKGHWKGWG